MTRALIFLCCGLFFLSLGMLIPDRYQERHLAQVVSIGVAGTEPQNTVDRSSLFIPPSTKVTPVLPTLVKSPIARNTTTPTGRSDAEDRTHLKLQRDILKASRHAAPVKPAEPDAAESRVVAVSVPVKRSPPSKAPVSAPPKLEPSLSPARRYQVVVSLQRALRDANCYSGQVDGVWGRGSRAAMSAFNRKINSRLSVEQPRELLLTIVQSRSGVSCGRPKVPEQVVASRSDPGAPDDVAEKKVAKTAKVLAGRILPRSGSDLPTATVRVIAPSKPKAVPFGTAPRIAAIETPETGISSTRGAAAEVPPGAAQPRNVLAPETGALAKQQAAAAKKKARARRLAKVRRAKARRARARRIARARRARSGRSFQYNGRRVFSFQAPRRYRRSSGSLYGNQPKWARDAFTGNN